MNPPYEIDEDILLRAREFVRAGGSTSPVALKNALKCDGVTALRLARRVDREKTTPPPQPRTVTSLPKTQRQHDAPRAAVVDGLVKGCAAIFVIGMLIYFIWPRSTSAPSQLSTAPAQVSASPASTLSAPLRNTLPAEPWRDETWADEMKKKVAARLRDPSSAQFRGVQTHHNSGLPIVCGEVNAKNGFGGYAGYERFIAAGDSVFLESDMAEGAMNELDVKLCR